MIWSDILILSSKTRAVKQKSNQNVYLTDIWRTKRWKKANEIFGMRYVTIWTDPHPPCNTKDETESIVEKSKRTNIQKIPSFRG